MGSNVSLGERRGSSFRFCLIKILGVNNEGKGSRGGGILPYLGYMGTCRWTGYGFLDSLS